MLKFFVARVPRQVQSVKCNVSPCVCVFLPSSQTFCHLLDSVAVCFISFGANIRTPQDV